MKLGLNFELLDISFSGEATAFLLIVQFFPGNTMGPRGNYYKRTIVVVIVGRTSLVKISKLKKKNRTISIIIEDNVKFVPSLS